MWGSVDYLLWWVKSGPLPIPVATSGDINNAGVVGQPGTTVLFGGSNMNYGAQSGLRLTLGGWLSSDQVVGAEVGGFLLEQRTVGFAAHSDAAGNPVLAVPFVDAGTGTPDVIIGSAPASTGELITGGLAVTSSTRFWGSDANAVWNVHRGNRLKLNLLGGFRYAGLRENLILTGAAQEDLGPGDTPFVTGSDRFTAENNFYGGQVGARALVQFNRFALAMTTKVALGSNVETVTIDGSRTQVGGASGSGVTPGFIYALPTNMGQTTHGQFAVLPEAQLALAYQVTRRVWVSFGYTFLYLSDVVRPGNQIDPVLNISQRDGGALVGPAAPVPFFNHSDFWAQGINFGLGVAY
jgi:hypothetical protein